MSYYWLEINFIIFCYLIGTIPVGLLLSKLYDTPNPRNHGSGNIGTTNMLRVGGRKLAIFTFLLDLSKGLIVVLLSYLFVPNLYQIAGMIVVIGHIFPVWLLFKGGKGVAPAFGVLLAWDVNLAFAALMTWIALVGTTRYVSVGSLAAALISPIATYVLNEETFLLATIVLTGFIVLSHRSNIYRLIKGEEPQIGGKSRE